MSFSEITGINQNCVNTSRNFFLDRIIEYYMYDTYIFIYLHHVII